MQDNRKNSIETDTLSKDQSPLIIITRPEPEATATAQIIESQYYQCLTQPLMTLQPISEGADQILSRHSHFIISSPRALGTVTLSDRQLKNSFFYLVGQKTAQSLKNMGVLEQSIQCCVANIDELIEFLTSAPDQNTYLYLRGTYTEKPLRKILAQQGHQIEEYISYSMDPIAEFHKDMQNALGQFRPLVILLYSTRTARIFSNLLAHHHTSHGSIMAPLHFICLSPKISQNIDIKSFYHEYKQDHADFPDENSLIEKLMLKYRPKI